MQEEVIYRCINAGCARPLPRRVNFCPYCGTAQQAGVVNPALVPAVAAAAPAQRAPEPVVPPAPPAAAVQAAPASPPQPPAPPPPAKPAPPGVPARPPQPRPVRMRYWVLALGALWLVWIIAKPTSKKMDARVDQAVALADECQLDAARKELAALRGTKAAREQLGRIEKAIGDAVPSCERKRLRARAWNETTSAVSGALAASAFDKAGSRLAAFARRWGEDADTRELKGQIELRQGEHFLDEADGCLLKGDAACVERRADAAERLRRPELLQRIAALREAMAQRAPPVARPPDNVQQARSARNLLADAERELTQGNYKAAMDKMEICAAMVDAGNRQCIALRQRAERLHREMLRCVAAGKEWFNDRCQ